MLGQFEIGAASTRESASEEIMIRRRDVPLAAAAHGLAIWSGSAFAQTKGPDEEGSRDCPDTGRRRTSESTSILAPVRDEHHFPGLIGAIVEG